MTDRRGSTRRYGAAGLFAAALAALLLAAPFLARQPAAAADDVVLTEQGLGPIAAGTTLDLATATTVSDRFRAEAFAASPDGVPMPGVVLLNRKGVRVAEALYRGEGLPLDRIVVLRKAIANSFGHRVGDLFADIVPEAEVAARCVAGAEEFSGMAVCVEAPGSRLAVAFSGRWDGPDGILPPASVLAGWKAQKLLWTAPRGAE